MGFYAGRAALGDHTAEPARWCPLSDLGAANMNRAMKATLMKNAASTRPTVIKNVSPAELLAMARAMGKLATEDVEASRAIRFAVHFFAAEQMMTESLVARVMAWMAEKRTEVNNDPRIVPGILGVAEPITVPTW